MLDGEKVIYYSGEQGCVQDQICDILFMAMVCLCVRLEGWGGGEGELSSNAEHMGTLKLRLVPLH